MISLILQGYICGFALTFEALINHLPNIEKLLFYSLEDCSFIKHISKTLKKLTMLDVQYFDGDAFDGLRFKALQSLEIHCVNSPVNWDALTRNNAGFTELSMANVYQRARLDIQAITNNLKKLRTLTIKTDLNRDEKFFSTIRQICKELKSLNLNARSLKLHISTVADIPGLRFRNF